MSAIGAIGSYGSISGYDSFYRNRDRGPFGTEPVSPVSRAQTAPVPPVSAVPAVRRGTAQPVPEEQESAFPFPTLREGADPAEMAVRARIHHLDGEAEELDGSFSPRTMLPLAVATSIDALAVGVTFAFLQVDILPAVLLIGATTFLLSAAGVKVGSAFGVRFKSRAELAGGLILMGMGVKILLEHTLLA